MRSKNLILIAVSLMSIVFVSAFCGTIIDIFSEGQSDDTIVFSDGGSTNSSVKVRVPMLTGGTTIADAIVNLSGRPRALTLDKPVDVVLVTDVSASMDDDCGPDGIAQPGEHPCKVEDAKAADRGFVNLVTTVVNNTVGLVSYSTTLQNSVPLTNDNNTLFPEIDTYFPWGFTCIECGLDEGIQLMQSGQNKVQAIILMSDGEANRCLTGYCNPGNAKANAIAKAATAWNVHGIHVYAIAFNGESDIATMMAIAAAGNGSYYYSNNSNIYQIYQDIAVELTQLYPTDPELNVGSTGPAEWTFVGEYDGNEQVNFTPELDSIMDTCTCPGCYVDGSDCIVDMEIMSTTTGYIDFHDLRIVYHHTVDTTCDGIDEDCSGENDEDYVPVACGDMECAGDTVCVQNGGLNSGDATVDCQNSSGVSQLGTDCGICCICAGTLADPYELYDNSQDGDCTDTPCDDSCNINPDDKPATWDYAPDVPNYCSGLKACTTNTCSYQHECHDDDPTDGVGNLSTSCTAACDQHSDCEDKCEADNVRYYDGECALGEDCSCSWNSFVDCDDYDYNFSKGFTCNETVGDIFNYYENWQCALGGCEYSGNEWEESLKEDCVDDCSDTDGGQVYETMGTATDEDLCQKDNQTCPRINYTDYCISPTGLIEYFCDGENVEWEDINCNDYDDDYLVGTFCNLTDGDIYDYLENWDCDLGGCSYTGNDWQNDSSKVDCVDTCTDPDGLDKYTQETVNDKDLCDELNEITCPEVNNTDVCYDSGNVTEFYCDGLNYASQLMNCDDDDCTTPGQYVCQGMNTDTIYEEGDDYGCSAGACGYVGKTTCDGPWECNESRLCTQQACGVENPTCFFDGGYQWGDPGSETECSNGLDDDCDGYIDCADPDCFGVNLNEPCGTGACPGNKICDSVLGQNTWYCDSNGTVCSSTNYCDNATLCDGYQLFAVCDETGTCGAEDNRDDDVDDACGGQDCGLCCVCDTGGDRIFDGAQDDECSDTPCEGGCDKDGDTDTWDFEHTVPNICVDVDTCSQNACDYDSECRDDDPFDGVNSFLCDAECDEESDCPPYLENDICYYQNPCDSGCGCDIGLDEPCPPPGTVDGDTCYYGIRYCTDPEGCEILECTLEEGEYCDSEAGCLDSPCINFSESFGGTASFPFDGGSNDSIKRSYSTNSTIFTANGSVTGKALSYRAELDLVVVTDVSKSMENFSKLENAQLASKAIVDFILPSVTNQIGLVSYQSILSSSLDLTDDNVSLQDEIDSYFPWGFTCISCGLAEGINIMNAGDNPTKVILIMTDGIANRCTYGYCSEGTARTEAIGFAQAAWDDFGIRVYAVAYGDDADNYTMQQIAEKGNGKFFSAGVENITDIYQQIINLSTLVYPLDVTVDVGEDSVLEFFQPGILNDTFPVSDFATGLQGLIDDCDTTPCPGCSYDAPSKMCTIDFTIESNKAGLVDAMFDVTGCVAGPTIRPDSDGDGVVDPIDNCPDDYNLDQLDFDDDRIGDICDSDDDNDCLPDSVDPCPFDYDCDDDGLGDGNCSTEDSNADGIVDINETDPQNWDTDGDGLSDGQERGLVKPEGKNTDPNVFKKDDDPSTTTDPLNPDTDGDGINDGDEDANKNGRVDEGETDPNIPDTDGDNDGFVGGFDLCPDEPGDCNGCPIACTGCAEEVCPAEDIPYCEAGICDPVTCPEDVCGEYGCNFDEKAVFPVSVPRTCDVVQSHGTCVGTCEPVCTAYPACEEPDGDGDGFPDSSDLCPGDYGLCYGCSVVCDGCAVEYCPDQEGAPSCVPDNSQCPTACPTSPVCGGEDCTDEEKPVYTGENVCELDGNTGTCTDYECEYTCETDQACIGCPQISVDVLGGPFQSGEYVTLSIDYVPCPGETNGVLIGVQVNKGDLVIITGQGPWTGDNMQESFKLPDDAQGTYTAYVAANGASDSEEFLVEGGCVLDSDCEDSSECTVDTCNAGICEYADVQDGTMCSLGYCQAGVCEEDDEVPLPPTGLDAEVTNSILLTWTASASGDVVGYNIYKSDGGLDNFDFNDPIDTVASDVFEWLDTTDGDVAQRYYIVRAYDAFDNEDDNTDMAGKITYNLVKKGGSTGNNLVSIPLNTNLATASDVMTSVGPVCDAVNRFDPVEQDADGWLSILDGIGNNFDIVLGEAIAISVTESTDWTVAGTVPDSWPTIELIKKGGSTGKNWVGLPLDTSLANAADIIASVGGTCEGVNRWDASSQTSDGYNGVIGPNFAVDPLEGFEVHVSADTSWAQ